MAIPFFMHDTTGGEEVDQAIQGLGIADLIIRSDYFSMRANERKSHLENKHISSKIPYTGLGLVFGTAIGAGITVAIGQPIFWAGAGTGIGLVLDAIIDSTKKK